MRRLSPKIWQAKRLEAKIEAYLSVHLHQARPPAKAYCGAVVLGGQGNATHAKVYVWAHCSAFFANKEKRLATQSGSSLPVVLHFTRKHKALVTIRKHESPGDGSFFTRDVRRLFPPYLHHTIIRRPASFNQRLQKLSQHLRSKARRELLPILRPIPKRQSPASAPAPPTRRPRLRPLPRPIQRSRS